MNETIPDLSAATTQRTSHRWLPWVILWCALAVVQVALLADDAALDTLAWRTTRWFTGDQDAYTWAKYKAEHANDPAAPFYQRVDPPMTRLNNGVLQARFYARTEKFWRLLRDMGEPQMTLVLLIVISIYDRRRLKAGVVMLLATGAAGGLGALIRIIDGRYRPIETDGLNHWVLFRGFHDGSDLAYPSGHATLAFATAAVLTYFSPRGKWLWVVLAAGCAVARVVMQAHFWSDVIFGAVLGWTVGWFVTRMGSERIAEG